jgi:phosphoribosyl 1,2-cyclic phosphodiesterase
LVDCGPDFSRQLWQFRIEKLAAVFLTHSHWDHIAGLDYLHHYRDAPGVSDRKPQVPVYATEPCLEDVLVGRGFQYLVHNGIIQPRVIQPGISVELGGLTITPFAVNHGPTAPGAIGLVFECASSARQYRVLYSGDFYELVPPTEDFFARQFDLAILECNQWQPRRNGHISFAQILDLLTEGPLAHAQIRQLTLIHFSEYGPNGSASTYLDWRTAAATQLRCRGLEHLIPDEDALIAYEGLTFHFP